MEIYQKLITSISKKTFGRVFREECPRFSAATNPPLAMLMSARENHDAKDLDIGLFLLSLSPPCQAALKVCTELLRLSFHKEHDGLLQELERGAMVQMKVEIEPILDLLHRIRQAKRHRKSHDARSWKGMIQLRWTYLNQSF